MKNIKFLQYEWKKVGTVNASQKKFVFDVSNQESNFYKFSVRGKHNMLPAWLISE